MINSKAIFRCKGNDMKYPDGSRWPESVKETERIIDGSWFPA